MFCKIMCLLCYIELVSRLSRWTSISRGLSRLASRNKCEPAVTVDLSHGLACCVRIWINEYAKYEYAKCELRPHLLLITSEVERWLVANASRDSIYWARFVRSCTTTVYHSRVTPTQSGSRTLDPSTRYNQRPLTPTFEFTARLALVLVIDRLVKKLL